LLNGVFTLGGLGGEWEGVGGEMRGGAMRLWVTARFGWVLAAGWRLGQ